MRPESKHLTKHAGIRYCCLLSTPQLPVLPSITAAQSRQSHQAHRIHTVIQVLVLELALEPNRVQTQVTHMPQL